jgi:putative hemolysin
MSAVLDSKTVCTRRGAEVIPADRKPLASAGDLVVSLAGSSQEIEAALRLRYSVFAGELGARLASDRGLDRDSFDPYCDHLIVTDTTTGRVVGTYRVLLPQAANEAGCFYSDHEFRLTRLAPIRSQTVELGRSCVHPDYRSGAVIMLLWSGLGQFLSGQGCRYLIGCASVSLADGGATAANLYRKLAATHLSDPIHRVWPRDRLPIEEFDTVGEVTVPPLFKGYLRAGARLLGEPHRDPEFGVADFPMMLELESVNSRYQRRFAPDLLRN